MISPVSLLWDNVIESLEVNAPQKRRKVGRSIFQQSNVPDFWIPQPHVTVFKKRRVSFNEHVDVVIIDAH